MRQRKVVDACVWIAYISETDKFHKAASKFFKDVNGNQDTQVILPVLASFEINSVVRRKKRTPNEKTRSSFKAYNSEIYDIDRTFLGKCQVANVWDKLSVPGIRSQDLVYASIAYIEGVPLVTTDERMAKALKGVLQVELLK